VSTSAERALYALSFWLKRRDVDAVCDVMAGVSEAERAEMRSTMDVPGVMRALYDMPEPELRARMLGLASKAHQPLVQTRRRAMTLTELARSGVPSGPQAYVVERKIIDGGEAKSMTAIEAPPGAGSFEGYAATWLDRGGPDQGGDVIAPGSFAEWVQEVNSGDRVVPIVAGGDTGHSNAPLAVVGRVVQAREDATGLWISASMSTDPDAQLLRQKITSGALTGLSILYTPAATRMVTLPSGQEARELSGPIVVHHVALTPVPMNTSARIVGAKAGGAWTPTAPIVDIYAQAQARHRDPDRDRLRRMAEVVAASWVSPGLAAAIGTQAAYDLVMGAAEAKAARELQGDPERARQRERWEQANRYSSDLAAWMAANR
jgi:HK97 family phage prohead protease